MTKTQARLIVYQLIEARQTLQDIAQGKGNSQEKATAYFFRMLGVDEGEVDAFFSDPDGQRLVSQFHIR